MKKAAHIFATGINQTALNHSFIKRPPTDTTVGRQVRALKQRYNFLRPYIFGYIGRQFSTIVAHNIFIRTCSPRKRPNFPFRTNPPLRSSQTGNAPIAERVFGKSGARIFHFPNQNEKVPAPRFSERGNRKLWRANISPILISLLIFCRGNRKLWRANPSFSLNTIAHEMMRLHAK